MNYILRGFKSHFSHIMFFINYSTKLLSSLNRKIVKGTEHISNYPTPVNLDYSWSFGFIAGLCLSIQIISGLFLAMYYSPDISLAFYSVEYLLREVNGGHFLKHTHANGASLFMLFLYIHIFRGLYFGSYATQKRVWASGMVYTY